MSSSFVQGAALIGGYDARVLASIFPRERVAATLDRAGIDERRRESVLRSLDAIAQAGAAWEQACAARLAASEVGMSELPHDELPASLGAVTGPTVTTGQAAGLLSCSDRNVRLLLERGRLPGCREGRMWRVDRAAVLEMAAEREER